MPLKAYDFIGREKKKKKKGPTNKQGTTIYIQKNFVDQCLFCQFVGIQYTGLPWDIDGPWDKSVF